MEINGSTLVRLTWHIFSLILGGHTDMSVSIPTEQLPNQQDSVVVLSLAPEFMEHFLPFSNYMHVSAHFGNLSGTSQDCQGLCSHFAHI